MTTDARTELAWLRVAALERECARLREANAALQEQLRVWQLANDTLRKALEKAERERAEA